jgi:hypothetical protein
MTTLSEVIKARANVIHRKLKETVLLWQRTVFSRGSFMWKCNIFKGKSKKIGATHWACFLVYDWPWLRYLGNEMDCCAIDHYLLLNTEQKLSPRSPLSGGYKYGERECWRGPAANLLYWTEAVQVTKTNDKPDLPSEGAPVIDKTIIVNVNRNKYQVVRPAWALKPGLTDRLVVGRKVTLTLTWKIKSVSPLNPVSI